MTWTHKRGLKQVHGEIIWPRETAEFSFEIKPETEDAVVTQIEVIIDAEDPKLKNYVIQLRNDDTGEVATVFERPAWSYQSKYAETFDWLAPWIWGASGAAWFMDWVDSINIYEATADFYYTDIEKVNAYISSRIFYGDTNIYTNSSGIFVGDKDSYESGSS